MKLRLLLLLLFLLSCCSTTVGSIQDQQFVVRNVIDDCSTFDCSVLDKEKVILQNYIDEGASPVIQGVQQSIVTTITRRCNKDLSTISCIEYEREMKKLRQLLEKFQK